MVDTKHIYEYEIIFDKTNLNWMGYSTDNIFMLGHLEDRVNIILYHNGYIYLNQIYEILGLKWDPKDYNRCFIADSEHKHPFEFDVFKQSKDSMKVIIRYRSAEESEEDNQDLMVRQILSELSGLPVDDSISSHTKKIIFG